MTEQQLTAVKTEMIHSVRVPKEAELSDRMQAIRDNPELTVELRQDPDQSEMVSVRVSASMMDADRSHLVSTTLVGEYQLSSDAVSWASEPAQHPDEADEFVNSAVTELFPFLRQAIYDTSSRVAPNKPIFISGITRANRQDAQATNSETDEPDPDA